MSVKNVGPEVMWSNTSQWNKLPTGGVLEEIYTTYHVYIAGLENSHGTHRVIPLPNGEMRAEEKKFGPGEVFECEVCRVKLRSISDDQA